MSSTENNAQAEAEPTKKEESAGSGDDIKKHVEKEEDTPMDVDGGGDPLTGNGDVEKEESEEEKDDEDMEEEEEVKKKDEEQEEKKEDEGATEKEEKKEEKKEKKEVKVEKSPKKPSKKKEEKKESDEEEEEEESEHKLGLLEQPVVLTEGRKREKKKVERLEFTVKETPKDKKIVGGEGNGEKLGDIPRVELQLGKTRADELKPLHRLLFARVGTANEIKKNIRKFNGFAFKSSSTDHDKKTQYLTKLTMVQLKSFCDTLDLERGGTKEAIIDRIMEFLLKPKASGKALPKPKRRSSSTKRTSSGKKKKAGTKKKETTKKKAKPKSKSKEEVEEDSSEEEEEEEEEEGEGEGEEEEQDDSDSDAEKSESEAESDEEPPKKKKRKVEPKKTPKTPPKKETKKPEKKAEKKAPPKKAESDSDSDDDSSDDEPLVAKKKEPSNDEIKELVKKILDGANLEEVTMKTVCKQVYEKYPDHDLTSKKDFIKATVKQIIR